MDGNMQIDPDPEEDKRVSNFIFSTPTSPEKISSTGSYNNNVFTGSSKSTESSGFTFAKPEIVETSIFNFAKPTVFSNSDNNDTSMFGKPANEVSPFAKPALKENSYFSNPFTNTATSYSKPFASESSFGKSSASNTSPFAKPITSEASVLTKPATNESSIKSLASEASPFAKPSINEASPFAKPSTNEVSPFAKPSTNEASPFAKPSTNDTSPFAKPSTNEASPFAKPSIGESSPFAKSSTNDASPFAKPSTNETSPFAKPSISESSPFVKPSISESSPFVKPSISESSPFSKSAPNTQPTFGKSSADETSAFRKSSTSEISPFVKPSSNEASYFTKPSVNEDSLTEKSTIKETGKIPIHARLSKRSEYPDEPIVITDDDTSSSETTSEKSLKRSSLRSRRSSRSDLNASDIKKTSAFTQLQKNSKKTSDIKLDLANSITCSDVPESLLVKTVAKEYFEQFGNILKITIRPRRKIIVVYFSSKVTATKAFVKSGKFLNHEFKVEWTKPDSLSSKPKKVESFKKRITSFLNIDDDVKEELEALKGLEYNMPEPSSHIKTSIAKARVKKAMVVANREVPKRSGLISKSSLLKPSRTLHKEKSIPKPMPKAQAPVEESKLKFVTSLSIDELRKQIRQPALSSEDKYKVLDARDKLMRLKQNKQTSLATAKITQGTCPDMCPEKERYMREFQRQLATYEQMEPGSTDYKINHLTAVKQYSRSSADQEEPMAHDLRPLKSLKMTMSYLLHEISDLCDSDDVSLTEWYHYLWDRMRSIRKDITQQELCCVDTVELVEQCARFHILSSERLCAEETSVFDPKINSENLTKCLQTLKYMYYDLREAGTTCKNEPEFQAYVILLNLNNGSFVSDLSTLPPNIQKSDEVKFALSVYSALAMDNYSRFFKLVRQTTYLNGCILMRYFNQVRVKALNIMVKAYCRTSATTEYPLYELIDILGFEDEDEVNHFCNQTGLKCDRDNLYIKLKKDNFHQPDGQIEQGRAYNLILSKRQAINQAVGQCIAGGEWPEKIHINHQPHSSFDDNGYLLSNAYNAQDQGKTDVYDMMDEDGDVEFSEVKEIKKVEEKKLPIVNQTNSESTFKAQPMRSYASTTAPSASKPIFGQSQFSPPSSTSFRSPENKSFVAFSTPTPSIFSQSTHASTSMFNSTPLPQVQPANTTPFSNANSPFNMAVSKGIFSGYPASQTNVFGIAVQSVSSKMTTDVSNKTNEKQDNKRRHEDQLNQNDLEEKRRMMDRDEEERKKREIETAKRAEYEKQLRLELLNKRAAADCEMMQTEVLNDMCSEIVQAEMERIALMDALSSKIFNDLVQEICESLLDQQLFVQDMLIEVERRTRDRLCRKYLRCWRQCIDKRRLHRREALDNTPVWLQNESLEETAKKMYCPEMKIAVKYAKDNRRRSNPEDKISTESVRTPKQTPIEFVVCVGLKENTKNLAEEMRSNDYWKMVVSWPVLDNKLIVWRHKKLISQYLSPSDPTQEPIVIQHKFAGNESLTMCIRQFEGLSFEQSLTGTDALLLVCCADEDNRSVARRLTKAIVSREKLPPVPLVVLIFGDDQLECNSLDVDSLVEPLLESGHIGEYTVLKEHSSSEEVVIRVLQSATLWLAINRASPVPLQMDFLHRILEDCISDDLWLKIHNHLGANEKFNNPLNDPNFVIDLHNEAINHLVDIMLDPESLAYTDFAPELKIYLGQNHSRAYPCGYEYFDILWKQPEYRAELERLISSFTFPRWNFPWPIHDPLKLHNAILAYSRQILSHESLTIARDIISNLYLISSFEDSDSENVEENKNVCRLDCFSEILVHIVERKIADLPSNVRVVYNKQHIQNFRKLPWWYKSNVLLNYLENQEDEGAFEITEETDHATTTQIEQSKSVSSVASEADDDEFHVDLELNELEQTIHEVQVERPIQVLEDEVKETNAEFEDWSKEFDRKLEEQLKRNEEFEARLKKALEDDDIVGTS